MEGRCPNCGYCPHCGRGSSDPYPIVPSGPYWEDADSSINTDRLVIHEEIGEDSVVDEEVDWV